MESNVPHHSFSCHAFIRFCVLPCKAEPYINYLIIISFAVHHLHLQIIPYTKLTYTDVTSIIIKKGYSLPAGPTANGFHSSFQPLKPRGSFPLHLQNRVYDLLDLGKLHVRHTVFRDPYLRRDHMMVMSESCLGKLLLCTAVSTAVKHDHAVCIFDHVCKHISSLLCTHPEISSRSPL